MFMAWRTATLMPKDIERILKLASDWKKSLKVIKLIEHAIKANGFHLINLLSWIRNLPLVLKRNRFNKIKTDNRVNVLWRTWIE